ncbi:MAG: hypothetical protein AMXMBFR57_27970 [Acidimicrobiia bacterium]
MAGYFEMSDAEAARTIKDVGAAVGRWRPTAVRYGVSKTEIDRMSSAFEHEDLQRATR